MRLEDFDALAGTTPSSVLGRALVALVPLPLLLSPPMLLLLLEEAIVDDDSVKLADCCVTR
jgi:hypothetical protein